MQHHVHRVGVRVLEADDEGQHDDADNIVDYGGAGYEGPDVAFKTPQLLQSLNGDAHGGGCHNGSDEYRREELFAAEGAEAVESAVQHRTARQRDEHAYAGHQQGLGAGLQQVAHIGLDAGAEHQQDDTDLRHHGQKIRLLHNA